MDITVLANFMEEKEETGRGKEKEKGEGRGIGEQGMEEKRRVGVRKRNQSIDKKMLQNLLELQCDLHYMKYLYISKRGWGC